MDCSCNASLLWGVAGLSDRDDICRVKNYPLWNKIGLTGVMFAKMSVVQIEMLHTYKAYIVSTLV